ncbi:beta-glucosidase [Poriferisphaera corsica]|uniref:beta-glucosidase n=1 Tax=Poriferisphaera corsica TaxID=2528020 RepID=UPI00190A40FA|nr:beta-glucosidase [Poriferisphaera corsica]
MVKNLFIALFTIGIFTSNIHAEEQTFSGQIPLNDQAKWEEIFKQRKAFQEKCYENARQLVEQMTLKEKAALFGMDSKSVDRFGISRHHWWNEAIHGVARNGRATQFPVSIAMGSTWDPELIYNMSSAIGQEARAKYHESPGKVRRYEGLTIWSPTINMARDPRWGRNDETYGEDPFLTSEMAVAFVKGIQGTHPEYYQTIATIKHFIANNTEHNREFSSPQIKQSVLRDYYMPAYREAVQKADAQSIMTAYNGVNGVPCTVNEWLLTDVLRNEWGFHGTVVTDVGAPKFLVTRHKYVETYAEAIALMINAGVDLNAMGTDLLYKYLGHAIERGLITDGAIDRAITQNLTTRMQLGQIIDDSSNPYKNTPMSVVGSDEHLAIAQEIAEKGTVLLQNKPVKGNALLPLGSRKIKKIIVAGPYGNVGELGGYSGTPTRRVSTVYGALKEAAKDVDVELEVWMNFSEPVPIPNSNLRPPVGFEGETGLKAEYFRGTAVQGVPQAVRLDPSIDREWEKPLENIDPEVPQPQFAVRWSGSLVPDVSGEYKISVKVDDGMRVWLDGQEIINEWRRGAARVVDATPVNLEAGKAYPLRVEFFDNGGKASSHLMWSLKEKPEENKIEEPDSTVVVFVCGFNLQIAREFVDHEDLSLPEIQMRSLRKWLAKTKNVIVVLNGGTIITEPWLFENVPAVLHAWYPGQEGGYALSNLLLGKSNPSGHLPMTWFKSVEQLPHLDDYDVTKGRTYQYSTAMPQFPFGHGLSYTSFSYENVKLSSDRLAEDDTILVSLNVRNTGDVAGADVVQIYARDLDPTKQNVIKKLVGFGRVEVKPGQTEEVSIEIPVERLASWNQSKQVMDVGQGKFELQIGTSSRGIEARETIEISQ